jgi:hypothetical protein
MLSLLHNFQSDSRAHTTSYSLGMGDNFPGIKRQGREADHSHLPSAEVKNGEITPPLLRMPSWHSD